MQQQQQQQQQQSGAGQQQQQQQDEQQQQGGGGQQQGGQQQQQQQQQSSEPMATVPCVYCSTTLSYPQNSLYIQCPRCQNTMNPAAPHASYVNCFTEDHQLLTAHGFMFVGELRAHEAAHGPVAVATYNPADKTLSYRPYRQLIEQQGKHSIIDIVGTNEAEHWDAQSDEYGREDRSGEPKQSYHVSLSVTANHDMYVVEGRKAVGHRTINWKPRGVKNAYVKKSAGSLMSTDPLVAVKLMAAASEGLKVTREELPFISALGLSTQDQVDAFLELYGYWLGDGSLDFSKSRAEIRLNSKKPQDVAWLAALLARLPLVSEQDYWAAPNAYANGLRPTLIHAPKWTAFFAAEYGYKYAGGPSKGASSVGPAVDDPELHLKSAKWFAAWVLRDLVKSEMRLVLRGLWVADGKCKSGDTVIFTSSVRFRDELVQACLHGGYSAYFGVEHKKNDVKNVLNNAPVVATADGWRVCYSDDEKTAHPTLHNSTDVKQRDFEGRVWCVEVPPYNMLVVRRAAVNAKGIVTKASRPIITYNCVGCNTLLSHPPTSLTIQCPKCLTVMDLPARGLANPGGLLPGLGGVGMDSGGRKSRKKRKDPNAPKRATNAYMIFCKERRASLKEEHPELQFGKLGARLGEMWRLMSAEEKRPYENRATGDRDRYKTEMSSYQSANMLKGNLGQLDEYNSAVSGGGGPSKKSKLDDGSMGGVGGGVGGANIDFSGLGGMDPAQLELLQQQQQALFAFQQQQQLAGMQAAIAAAAGAGGQNVGGLDPASYQQLAQMQQLQQQQMQMQQGGQGGGQGQQGQLQQQQPSSNSGSADSTTPAGATTGTTQQQQQQQDQSTATGNNNSNNNSSSSNKAGNKAGGESEEEEEDDE